MSYRAWEDQTEGLVGSESNQNLYVLAEGHADTFGIAPVRGLAENACRDLRRAFPAIFELQFDPNSTDFEVVFSRVRENKPVGEA
ncbi:MAG TPA: hypothetical protein PKH07_04265 [bacterium]|nr:hypothetical protein [bacterium]